MKNRFEIDQAEAASTQRREASLASFREFLKKHPEIPCAEDGAPAESVQRLFEEYADFDDSLTESDFEFAYSNLKGNISLRRIPTEAETKADLINRIMELLQGTNNAHWTIDHNIKSERTKMSFWSVEQLTARLDEVVRAQTLNAKPIGELKAIAASERQYVGFPTLGKAIVRPGTVRAVPLDAEYLRGLDSWELKKFVRLYGIDQVNDRLAGR